MYSHKYTRRLFEELKNLNAGDEYIFKCCNYAEELLNKELPVIFDSTHLNQILRLDDISLDDDYHIFYIDKKKGKQREINAPSENLKKRQRWILKNILEKINISHNVHGFIKGKSIVSNAKEHLNKEYVLNIDIKDFFPSVTRYSVENIFRKIGYCNSVAQLLARICCYRGSLPQGAPTSPYLANLVFDEVDQEIIDIVKNRGITYTRYADDMTFSSNYDLNTFKKEVYKLLGKHRFSPNIMKTHQMSGKRRKLVTGLIVDDKVKVCKEYKRKLRQEIYYCKKFGVINHLMNCNSKKSVNYREYLYGKAYFIKMVEETVGEKFLADLDSIDWY